MVLFSAAVLSILKDNLSTEIVLPKHFHIAFEEAHEILSRYEFRRDVASKIVSIKTVKKKWCGALKC